MAYYGGTVTVGGRNMLASLLRGGTIEFTRVVVGDGKLPTDAIPLDQTELVHEVAQGTSTPPIVKDGAVSLTVEYRNDLNGGLAEGFWLNEFGIYAQTDSVPETLFYYATLGDSPQPVSKYSKDRVDIRRYPLTIALEVDAEVRVLYDMSAFVTSENVLELVQHHVEQVLSSGAILPVKTEIIIPTDGWQAADLETEEGALGYKYVDVKAVGMKEESIPILALHPKSQSAARKCGMSVTCAGHENVLRVFSKQEPDEEIFGTLIMYMSGVDLRGDWSHVDPENLVDWSLMPPATATTLGGVKIGDNVGVTLDGTISVSSSQVVSSVVATTEDVDSMMDDVLGED